MPANRFSHGLLVALLASLLLPSARPAVAQPPGAAEPPGVADYRIADLAGRRLLIEVESALVTLSGWGRPSVEISLRPRREPKPLTLSESADVVHLAGAGAAGNAGRVVVNLPHEAAARIQIGDGELVLTGMNGEVDAMVRRGPITASRLSGPFTLETRDGDIRLDHASWPVQGTSRLRSFSGSIFVAADELLRAGRLLAVSLSGHVDSNPALEQRPGTRLFERVFGAGQGVVSLDTVRGNIVVRFPAR